MAKFMLFALAVGGFIGVAGAESSQQAEVIAASFSLPQKPGRSPPLMAWTDSTFGLMSI
jgi:hypothetical protein